MCIYTRFIYIVLVGPYNKLINLILSLLPYYKLGNWGIESLSTLLSYIKKVYAQICLTVKFLHLITEINCLIYSKGLNLAQSTHENSNP